MASVKRSCSSVGRDRSDAQDHHHQDHHDASEPRYTIRRLAHYTSMVGTPSSDTLNNDDTDDNNTNKIDSEKQYRWVIFFIIIIIRYVESMTELQYVVFLDQMQTIILSCGCNMVLIVLISSMTRSILKLVELLSCADNTQTDAKHRVWSFNKIFHNSYKNISLSDRLKRSQPQSEENMFQCFISDMTNWTWLAQDARADSH